MCLERNTSEVCQKIVQISRGVLQIRAIKESGLTFLGNPVYQQMVM